MNSQNLFHEYLYLTLLSWSKSKAGEQICPPAFFKTQLTQKVLKLKIYGFNTVTSTVLTSF